MKITFRCDPALIDLLPRPVPARAALPESVDEAALTRAISWVDGVPLLLVEAVRRDCELRMELLERRLASAQSAEGIVKAQE